MRKLQKEVQKNRKTYAPRSSNPKRRCYTFKIPEGVEEIDVHSFDWNNYIVKNQWLKSRAFDSPSGFFNLATRLHLQFYLLSCFICPMHCLPAVSYSDSLSDILTLTVLLRCRLFKWTLTTAPTLPRGTGTSLSGYFRLRSACLYVTGFTRCLVNSYFWRISLQICLLHGDRQSVSLRPGVSSPQSYIYSAVRWHRGHARPRTSGISIFSRSNP